MPPFQLMLYLTHRLPAVEKRKLESGIRKLLGELALKYSKYSFYGRMVQGDYIECALKAPEYALRIALLLKTFSQII
jgi:hypothetical protein